MIAVDSRAGVAFSGERQEMSYPKPHARLACLGGRHTECACYEILRFA
jgi:hypothetical protein